MDLTLSGEMTAHVLTMAKKDGQLARQLAEHFLVAIDKHAMAAYLLSGDVALELLAQRLRAHPDRTVQELAQLSSGETVRAGRRATPANRVKQGGRRRRRLGAGQAEQLRARVLAFLAKKPWSSRKQLTAVVEFPSLAIYNRIMGELKKEGEVKQKGGRSKSTYAVKGKVGAAKKSGTRLPKRATAKKARHVKKARPVKAAVKKAKAVKKLAPRLCPVPGCQNVAAPVFGMMCREHKDVPKAEQKKLFADRRAAARSS